MEPQLEMWSYPFNRNDPEYDRAIQAFIGGPRVIDATTHLPEARGLFEMGGGGDVPPGGPPLSRPATPPMVPAQEDHPPGWLGRLAQRLPDYGFRGLGPDAYSNALRAGLLHAGASMIGAEGDPFQVLGQGLRTGLQARGEALAGEARIADAEREQEGTRAEIARQRQLVAQLPDEHRARVSVFIGKPEFYDIYAKATTPAKPEIRSGDSPIVRVGANGDAEVIYEPPAEPEKYEPEYKVVNGALVHTNPDGGTPEVVIPKATDPKNPTDWKIDGRIVRVHPDGRVEELYGGDEEGGGEFDSSVENWIEQKAGDDLEVALEAWEAQRRAATRESPEGGAAWEQQNPRPTLGEFRRAAAETAKRSFGYTSGYLDQGDGERQRQPKEDLSGPATPGGPADRIRRERELESLLVEASAWPDQRFNESWARAQFARLIAGGADPATAAASVRKAYERFTSEAVQ